MNYIPAPEPADDVVIVPASEHQPAFTWGDHRMMEKTLKELEASDPNVMLARQRLDDYLEFNGWREGDPKRLVCSDCRRSPEQPHEEECQYRPARPEEIPVRDAHGYEYYSDKFEPLHMTSCPANDEEALDYFRIVDAFTYDREVRVTYIYKRAWGESEYKMMPYQYFRETKQVIPIGKRA